MIRKATNLMTRQPIIIKTTDRISECMDTFLRNEITSAPVVDATNMVQGILTEFNLLTAFTRYVIGGNDELMGMHLNLLEPAHICRESDPAPVVLSLMKQAHNQRLLVLDNFNHVVGIISPKDVMKYLATQLSPRGGQEPAR